MSKISIQQAAKLTGKHRDTINNATNSGKLSCTKNAAGHKQIDIAELERVFPLIKSLDALSEDVSERAGHDNKPADPSVKEELARLLERIKHREETNETMRLEREREREQLLAEIETLRTTLAKTQEQHGKAMNLLTDQRPGRDDKLDQLREQIAEQNVRFERVLSEAKKETRADTLREIKSLPWWRVAFGKKLTG